MFLELWLLNVIEFEFGFFNRLSYIPQMFNSDKSILRLYWALTEGGMRCSLFEDNALEVLYNYRSTHH